MNDVYIVDHKKSSLLFLETELLNWKEDIKVCQTVPNKIDSQKPSLIFLSTHWQRWKDHAQQLKKANHHVVLLSYDVRDALVAVELQLFGFLLRPADRKQLQKLKLRWKKLLQLKPLLEVNTTNLPQFADRNEAIYGIQLTDRIVFLKTEQIMRLEADNNYSIIYAKNGQKYVSAKSLKYFERVFEDKFYFRIHKSHLVNLLEVVEFKKDKATLTLTDGTEVEVSRRKKAELLNKISLI